MTEVLLVLLESSKERMCYLCLIKKSGWNSVVITNEVLPLSD